MTKILDYHPGIVFLAHPEYNSDMPFQDAKEIASNEGLDLVHIAYKDNANSIPVCRLVNYSKLKYTLKKLQKKSCTSTKKQIKIKPNIDINDLNVKVRQIQKFIEKKYTIHVIIVFKGRLCNYSRGQELLNGIMETTGKHTEIIKTGRNLMIVL